MNKRMLWLAIPAAFITMGISMPSCPGQQAMQQQLDGLQTKNAEAIKRVQTLESTIKTLDTEVTQLKTLVTQVSQTVLAQKEAIEKLESAKAPAKSAPKAKASKKKGR
jgi:septal ring factor EnvC (AmiA/AmiB activator)